MTRNLHVLVCGGGIAGCAVALSLRARGAAVTLVEREVPGARATGASAGMLTARWESEPGSPLHPLALRARGDADRFYAWVQELSGHPLELRRDGMLVANFAAEEHQAARARVAGGEAAGVGPGARVLDPSEAAEIQPGLGEARSWLWLPEEGQVDAQALATALEVALRRADVRLLSGIAVASVRSRGGVVTGGTLENGDRIPADRLVVACGAWSGRLEGLPRPLPVRPVRGQIVRLRPAPAGLRCLVGDHGGRYVVPRGDGSALAGSTMEDVGFDATVTAEGAAGIREAAARLVPALGRAEAEERWAGLRPLTPDGLPVLGLDPDLEGLAWAAGYGRNGILLAPLAGELLAGLLLGDAPGAELEAFRPDRF